MPGSLASTQSIADDVMAVIWASTLHPPSEGYVGLKGPGSLPRREDRNDVEVERPTVLATILFS